MLYVVTAVHNRYSITEKFVKQLVAQTEKNIRLLLVDDGCTDGTAQMVKSIIPESIILQGDGNLWWGGALHKAYKWLMKNAKSDDNIIIMNDDTFFDKNFLKNGLTLLKENIDDLITGYGVNVTTSKQADGAILFNSKNGRLELLLGNAEGNCTSTRALMMSFKSMRKIGGFHPILLPHYASDYEYTIRAARKGFKIKAFESFCYSFDDATTGNHDPKKATLKQIFSKRSVFNPIYRLSFILLITPVKHLPSHLATLIKRYIKKK